MDRQRDLVLVIGATGKQGGAVASELVGAGYRVRAMTRKPESDAAQALHRVGAEIVYGDLDDEASLGEALDDAWGAFSVQNTWETGVQREEDQGKRFARVARDAGVRHFVYSSVASAHRNTGIPHFDNKFRIEETVRGLGFPSHVVIRPVSFMENFLLPAFKPGIDRGTLAMAIEPRTPLQMIAVADIGRYGRHAFEQHQQLNGRAIDIAGDELTMPDVAGILSDITGRTISFVQTPIAEVRSFSEDYALMLEWFDRVGYDADIEGNARTYGIPPTRFREWAHTVSWS